MQYGKIPQLTISINDDDGCSIGVKGYTLLICHQISEEYFRSLQVSVSVDGYTNRKGCGLLARQEEERGSSGIVV